MFFIGKTKMDIIAVTVVKILYIHKKLKVCANIIGHRLLEAMMQI